MNNLLIFPLKTTKIQEIDRNIHTQPLKDEPPTSMTSGTIYKE